MAINSTYYLDADDLILSTAVYLDSSLTLIAPDGFYGDGTTTREQSSGILLVAEGCTSCASPCDTSVGGDGDVGVYKVNLDVGSSETGAIIVTFNSYNVPDGIRVTYDGVVYNKISSPTNGPFQCPNPGHFAIIGSTGGIGVCSSWYPSGQTQTNPVYLYNPTTSTFAPTGTTQVDVIVGTSSAPTLQPDYFIAAPLMGECVMVIPKSSATPSALLIEMIGPCTTALWNFSAACPVKLPTFLSSEVYANEGDVACAQVLINTFYFAKVHTDADNFVGLYDYVFFDENGRFPLADGFYLTDSAAAARQILEVENGVIVGITSCDAVPSCPDRRVVFQICNLNAVKDDNFDIYLNNVYIGAVDLNANAQIGSVFIADLNTAVTIGTPDFACPLSGMVTYHFNPALLQASNTLEMRNTQNNGMNNAGRIGVRNYQLTGTSLNSPCLITNLDFNGASGQSFTFNFLYTDCCS